jgi:predicted RNA binding protein YcfA (HicA-like mRNA interferase family)
MSIKSIPLKKYRKFLKHIGLKKVRTKSTHEIYNNPDNPLLRPVTVDSKFPDVPILHIHTSLKTIGMSKDEFEKIIKTL